MQSPWKVTLAFVGVFIAGAIFGGVFTLRASGKRFGDVAPAVAPTVATVTPPTAAPAEKRGEKRIEKAMEKSASPHPAPGSIAPAMMRQFTQRLNLTTDQREHVRPIVARAGEDFQRLQREHLLDQARVLDRMYQDVSSWLTSEQKGELDQMKSNWQERIRKEREKQGGAPSRPPASAAPMGAPAK